MSCYTYNARLVKTSCNTISLVFHHLRFVVFRLPSLCAPCNPITASFSLPTEPPRIHLFDSGQRQESCLFSKSRDFIWGPPSLCTRGINIACYLQLAQRLRMSGHIHHALQIYLQVLHENKFNLLYFT